MCHALIVTNEAAIAQLGERLSEVPKVRSSALALNRVLVELLPISNGHIVKTLPYSCRSCRRDVHTDACLCNAIKCSDLRRIGICPCVRFPVLSGISFMNVSWVRLKDKANQFLLSPCSGLAPHAALGVASRLSRRLVCCMGLC